MAGSSRAGSRSISIPSKVEVDVESIIRAAESGSVHPLLLNTPHLDERILEGMDDLDPSFRVWVLAKRQTIHDRLMRSLDAGLVAKDVSADVKKRHRNRHRQSRSDPRRGLLPSDAGACRARRCRGRAAHLQGAVGFAGRDYGMEPSAVTEELVAKIKLGAFERRAGDTGRWLDHRRALRATEGTLAGLFRRQSADSQGAGQDVPRAAALCDAWHRQRSCPSRAGISPTSRGVSGALPRMERGRSRSALTRCARPGCRIRALQYSIETTAYQAGTEINMVMVLRDDTTGIYVWSESFRLGLNNWFEAQQRIIRRIATSLNVQLSAERLMRLAGEPDVSLDVHDRWLRGQNLMAKFDPESWQRAVTIFRDAIRENPTFSPCYSSLVQMNNIEHFVHPGLLSRSRQGKSDA